MGNLRKDYVSERFVIVNQSESQKPKTKKNPYKAGNENMTNPSVLSLVQKDGMLQRLQDDEGDFVKNWSVRVFPASEPSVTIDADNSYTEHPLYSEPAYGFIILYLHLLMKKKHFPLLALNNGGMFYP